MFVFEFKELLCIKHFNLNSVYILLLQLLFTVDIDKKYL